MAKGLGCQTQAIVPKPLLTQALCTHFYQGNAQTAGQRISTIATRPTPSIHQQEKELQGFTSASAADALGASFGSVLFLFGSINPAAVIGFNQALAVAVASAPWVRRTAGLEDGLQEA